MFCPDVEVNHILREPQWKKLQFVIDSGVAEFVGPEGLIRWINPRESEGSRRGQTYLSASRKKLPNEKGLDLITPARSWGRATFRVAAVTRPHCSVSRTCDRENGMMFDYDGEVVCGEPWEWTEGSLLSSEPCTCHGHVH